MSALAPRGTPALRGGWGLVLLALGFLGCGGAGEGAGPVTPQVEAPSVAAPVRAVPSDLDVVLRIDLEAMRSAFPADVEARLAQALLGEDGASSGASEVMILALLQARQVWIGWRPGPDDWDNVFVLRGDFGELRETDLSRDFHPARALPNGWRVHEARSVTSRGAPAALYAHLDDLWVFASEAEIDAVERVLDGRAPEERLEPPERGVVSVAARMPSLVAQYRRVSPQAARLLEGARTVQASADLTAEGLSVAAEMSFEAEDLAEGAAEGLRRLLQAMRAAWSRKAQVSTVGATVGLDVRFPHDALAHLLR